jgi:hypothetical protein
MFAARCAISGEPRSGPEAGDGRFPPGNSGHRAAVHTPSLCRASLRERALCVWRAGYGDMQHARVRACRRIDQTRRADGARHSSVIDHSVEFEFHRRQRARAAAAGRRAQTRKQASKQQASIHPYARNTATAVVVTAATARRTHTKPNILFLSEALPHGEVHNNS